MLDMKICLLCSSQRDDLPTTKKNNPQLKGGHNYCFPHSTDEKGLIFDLKRLYCVLDCMII